MADSLPDYKDYTEEDFRNDPLFQDWVLQPTAATSAFWQQFVLDNPAKAGAVEAAAAFLTALRFNVHTIADEKIETLFLEHLRSVKAASAATSTVRRLLKRALAVAAVLAGVLVGVYFWQREPAEAPRLAVQTAWGEKKGLLLPDSSVVMLNGHSQVTCNKPWKRGAPREIWLQGEAFFDVKHLNKDARIVRPEERFLVHCSNLTIEVLGTAFNVRQRRGKTEVVLQNGSIRLLINNKARTRLLMKPGEMISYDAGAEAAVQTRIEPGKYVAWKEDKLHLLNPTLAEIARYLEDNYGKKIVISDPLLADKKIEGPILIDNLNDALFVVSTVLKTKVEKSDSVIVIGSK